MRRVIVVGWDGATWDLLLPWVRAGELPHLGRMLAEGAVGSLRSTIQPLTAVAWTSFLTGCRPANHGLFDFVLRPRGSYAVTLASRRHRYAPDLWRMLSDAGRRVAAVNVPMMVPVAPVNGILVGGIDAPGLAAETVYPPEFVAELRSAVPDYRIAASERTLQEWAFALRAMVAGRARLLDYLAARERWDCLMVVFSATDIAQHIFWEHMRTGDARYGDFIADIFRAADDALGRIIDRRDDDTTIILMSDHGAGPLRGALHLNRYLAQGGFLQPADRADFALATALRAGKRLLPSPWRAWLRRRFGAMRDSVESRLVAGSYDWSKTAVFSVGSYGHLFFNIAGREPEGIIPPDEAGDLAARVTAHLAALRDPENGRPLVARVWRGEEIYGGPALAQAPDLVVEWADYSYEIRSRYGDAGQDVFAPTAALNDLEPEIQLTATHRPDGIVAALGSHISPGSITGAHIVDLAPTILHLLDVPVPAHMDGRSLAALTGTLEPARLGPAVRVGPGEAIALGLDDSAIMARLRSLGYLQ